MAVEYLNWPAAVSLLGTVALVVGAFFKFFNKNEEWQHPVKDIEVRISKIEEKINSLEKNEGLSSKYSDHKDNQINERLTKTENKIEKLTDTIIKYIGNEKS